MTLAFKSHALMVAGRWRRRARRLLAGELQNDLEMLRASGQKITRAMSLARAA